MRAVIQRVKSSSVKVDNKIVGEIGVGFNVLLGVENGDNLDDAAYIINKISNLRVFEDSEGKMNLSLKDIDGEILLISQFTLLGDARKGNRPSFINAARPEVAEPLFNRVCDILGESFKVERGVFGADMEVGIVNDGPVTILLESKKNF